MDGAIRSTLRIWEDSPKSIRQDGACESPSGPHHTAEFAERLLACETLQPAWVPPPTQEGTEPYSLQWFLHIENYRHSRSGRWIPRLLEFAKHSGETLLGLGDGLGTDWLQYARHGASVVVCSSSSGQLALIRRNFDLRGLRGKFLHSAASSLPLENSSIDVACLSSMMDDVEDPETVLNEVYRVLKPGGKVLAVTPARYDIDYWYYTIYPWMRWFAPSKNESLPMTKYTRRGLHQLFSKFVEHRVHKRQLRRSDIPHVWRWIPMPVLERLMGKVLVLKAFKPLSAAIGVHEAA